MDQQNEGKTRHNSTELGELSHQLGSQKPLRESNVQRSTLKVQNK